MCNVFSLFWNDKEMDKIIEFSDLGFVDFIDLLFDEMVPHFYHHSRPLSSFLMLFFIIVVVF